MLMPGAPQNESRPTTQTLPLPLFQFTSEAKFTTLKWPR